MLGGNTMGNHIGVTQKTKRTGTVVTTEDIVQAAAIFIIFIGGFDLGLMLAPLLARL